MYNNYMIHVDNRIFLLLVVLFYKKLKKCNNSSLIKTKDDIDSQLKISRETLATKLLMKFLEG